MASERIRKQWLDDVKILENKVQEIYYLNDFEIAKKLEEQVKALKEKLLVINGDSYVYREEEMQIISEIVKINLEVDNYLKENQKTKGVEVNRIRYTNQLHEISSNVAANSTDELWEKLKSISNNWNKAAYSEIEKQTIKEEVSKVALNILESQAKKGEIININAINGICDKKELIEVMQAKLIKLAGSQDEKNKVSILCLAKELTDENLTDTLVWKVLSNVKDVKVAELETTKEIQALESLEEFGKNEEITALAVVEKQKSWLEKIIDKLKGKEIKKTTVYTFGDIDPSTGEWINVEKVIDEYPKGLKKCNGRKLLALEINDVEKIQRKHLKKYSDELRTVKFGRGVKVIGEGAFEGCEKLESVTFGDEVETIELWAFEMCINLESITMGKSIKSIKNGAFIHTGIKKIAIPDTVTRISGIVFQGCQKLKDISIGEGIRAIYWNAFWFSGLEKIKIPDTVREIHSGVFEGSDKLKEVILGSGIERYDGNVFKKCTSLERIWLPNDGRYENNEKIWKNLRKDIYGTKVFYYDPNKKEEDRAYNQIVETDELKRGRNIKIRNWIQEKNFIKDEEIVKDLEER